MSAESSNSGLQALSQVEDLNDVGDAPSDPCSPGKSIKRISVAEARKNVRKEKERWTNGALFQSLVGLAVTANAISLGLAADMEASYPDVFFTLEHVFTSLFFGELILRIIVEGFVVYIKDAANLVDFALVMLAVVDAWILGPLQSESNLNITSLLRLLRLLRLARLLRLFRVFKELTVIVKGFVNSMRTLFWAAIFLFVVVYAFSVFSATFFRNEVCKSSLSEASHSRLLKISGGDDATGVCYNKAENEQCCEQYVFNEEIGSQNELFGTIDRTMLTLFICTTEGCGMDVIKPMVTETPWLAVYWGLFMFITSFGILNIIVGLICDSVITASQDYEKQLSKTYDEIRLEHLETLKTLFVEMDIDGSRTVSREEFMESITENVKVMDCMESLGLHEEADLFDVLDVDQNGCLDLPEFFEGMMLLLRCNEPALVKDTIPTFLSCQRAGKERRKGRSESPEPSHPVYRERETHNTKHSAFEEYICKRVNDIDANVAVFQTSVMKQFASLQAQQERILECINNAKLEPSAAMKPGVEHENACPVPNPQIKSQKFSSLLQPEEVFEMFSKTSNTEIPQQPSTDQITAPENTSVACVKLEHAVASYLNVNAGGCECQGLTHGSICGRNHGDSSHHKSTR
eukprot:gnl/MRDRNA2_/MRDRNA2_86264_c0_seq1.p1 gnl/MRDRNA2_/MRDRNA2_86264_c0~~gnl/MRDRNA2_/MRDRNA2_86264_c0_seq1.p1  ORF type:complete len:634 (+),score=95.79 gnl/MRDRNA2_/MRDRNA2_86264_c0_seq1:120-2021(+)